MQERLESPAARILARSQRQAMDWSLVLVSQGIETAIDFSGDPPTWGLLVAPQDHDKALDAIRQYRLENLRRPWRRELFEAGVLFDAGSLAWAFLVIAFYWISSVQTRLPGLGMLDGSAVSDGQWWRLFTAMMLHADLAHLTTNLAFGILLLGLAMGRYGTGVGLLAAYLSGALGNVAAWTLGQAPHRSLGASGMIMGALGLLAVQSVTLWRKTKHAPKHVFTGLFGGLMLFVLLGLSPGTDILAHAGGFAGGLVIGTLLALAPPLAGNGAVNLLAGIGFAALVLIPWLAALR